MLRVQREQAIKARTLRAAASAPKTIKPPPKAEVDVDAITKFDCALKPDDILNFATLEPERNLCVLYFHKKIGRAFLERDYDIMGYGDDVDQDDQKKNKNDENDDDEDAEVSELEMLRKWKKENARPRSAAERCY